jgi:hypothetical protein
MEVTVGDPPEAILRLSASCRDTRNDCVVSVGRLADTIASLAVEYGAGLVVMGLANPEDSEPRKPGSIAYRVYVSPMLRSLSCPARKRKLRPTRQLAGMPCQSLQHLAESSPEH